MLKNAPTIDTPLLERILRTVEKPGRYVGNEWNRIRKDPRKVRSKVALVFPDVYEIGMSYLGQKILYHILNSRPEILAERVFTPWPDFESKLREAGLPLYSLENRIPLREFDIIGVSLLYELNFSNVLTVLDLGGIPLRAAERNDDMPLVIAGGPAAFNPEPVAGIFDALFLGDGEEAFLEIVERVRVLKAASTDRGGILRELSSVPGVYVPSLYRPVRTDRSPLVVPRPIDRAPARIEKRVLPRFRRTSFPEKIIVPGVRAVFDRVAVEAARGCPQNCRFCQATNIYFPFRAKSPNDVIRTMASSLRQTGYEDASLTALSIGDYPYLEESVRTLMEDLERRKVSLSLSSLRPGCLSPEIVENIVKVRKTGFTLVPEAGTDRLRRVINKKLTDTEIRDALTFAFSRGWKLVKLYFMVGLPTERDEDLEGIAALVREIVALGQGILGSPPRINLSVSSFIPKPHTPFQWVAMDDGRTLSEKQDYLRSELRRFRSVEFKTHPVATSLLEAAFSRGDRRLDAVLREAWRKGARFDSWSDHFDLERWLAAFDLAGVSPEDYWKGIDTGADLPWDHIGTGIRKSHLLRELGLALESRPSPSCAETTCRECGGCDLAGLKSAAPAEAIRVRPRSVPPAGTPTDALERYRVVFSKRGTARFLSHIDLIHVLQRAFRRAGVAVAQSQGFHPKMLISYGPALALGMEGRNELLEFRAPFLFEERAFVAGLNKCLPAGIRILGLERRAAGDPPLSRGLAGMVYALDMEAPEVREACGKAGGSSASIAAGARALAEGCADRLPPGVRVRPDGRKKKIFITVPVLPGKSPRPQDVVELVFGIANSVYLLTRERYVYESPGSRAGDTDGLPRD